MAFVCVGRSWVTPGSARTRQDAVLHLPKGMIPFGNLFCCRVLAVLAFLIGFALALLHWAVIKYII